MHSNIEVKESHVAPELQVADPWFDQKTLKKESNTVYNCTTLKKLRRKKVKNRLTFVENMSEHILACNTFLNKCAA